MLLSHRYVRWKDLLDWLLPVQHQTQQRTEQVLDLWTRLCIDNSTLNILWSELRAFTGEALGES